MKSIEDYIEEGRVEEIRKDLGKAKGLLHRSRRRLNEVKDRNISEDNAFLIFENIYESMRECIESLMTLKGFESEDHVATIDWAAEELNLERNKINKLHKYRKLRNASRYEAAEITKSDAEETLEFGESFIKEIGEKIESGLR